MSVSRVDVSIPDAVLAALPGRVRIADLTGRIVQRNESARVFDRENAKGNETTLRQLWELFAPCNPGSQEPIPYLQSPSMRALGGRVVGKELISLREGNRSAARDVYFYASPLRDPGGAVSGVLQIEEDEISEATLDGGELTGVRRIAHELNNALNPIMAASFLLARHSTSPDLVVKYAHSIGIAVEKSAAIVAGLIQGTGNGRAVPVFSTSAAASNEIRARILVAEDQDDVRDSLCRIIHGAGYGFHAVSTVSQAQKELADSTTGEYDLLLTDVGFPDGSGWDLVKFAASHNPGLPIGVLSGDNVHASSFNREAVNFVLDKPVHPLALTNSIAEALGERSEV